MDEEGNTKKNQDNWSSAIRGEYH